MKLITLGLAVSLSITARGAVVQDQQHSFASSIASSTNGDVTQMGQTFTVGVAGVLDRIEVLMFRLGGIFDPTGNPLLRVFTVAGGLPTDNVLATVTISELDVPLNNAAFVSFDVSSAALAVNVGDVLAFSVTATSGVGPYFLPNDQGQSPHYAGGAAVAKFGNAPWQFNAPDQDHGFRTFVNALTSLTGDYNGDGDVDAADYTTWRDALGGNANLPNDTTPGSVTAADYDVWKNNFGASAVAAVNAVPEPSGLALLLAVLACGVCRCRNLT